MKKKTANWLVDAALWLACSALAGTAVAGNVRGNWDPDFGGSLVGLNWTVHAELLVPDGCSSQQSGAYDLTYLTSSGPCAGSVVEGVFLRLYNDGYTANNWNDLSTYSSDPPGAATWALCDSSVSGDSYFQARCGANFAGYYGASSIRVVNGNVVGFDSTPALTWPIALITNVGGDSWPSSANLNQFGLYFTTNGPVLTCITCELQDIADTTNLTQFLVTYLANGDPKFTDENGNALGAVLNGSGEFVGLAAVPEPGSLALLFGALGAGWLVRRRDATA